MERAMYGKWKFPDLQSCAGKIKWSKLPIPDFRHPFRVSTSGVARFFSGPQIILLCPEGHLNHPLYVKSPLHPPSHSPSSQFLHHGLITASCRLGFAPIYSLRRISLETGSLLWPPSLLFLGKDCCKPRNAN